MMRIWDVPISCLCRNHLLAEHRELHAIWNILVFNKKGYRSHPEVKRWEGKLAALYRRHQAEVEELLRRGYQHLSPLDIRLAVGARHQDKMVEPLKVQRDKLVQKGCECEIVKGEK